MQGCALHADDASSNVQHHANTEGLFNLKFYFGCRSVCIVPPQHTMGSQPQGALGTWSHIVLYCTLLYSIVEQHIYIRNAPGSHSPSRDVGQRSNKRCCVMPHKTTIHNKGILLKYFYPIVKLSAFWQNKCKQSYFNGLYASTGWS